MLDYCIPISEVTYDCVPTTIPTLDDMIGGGFPKGRVITIVGKGGAGKTTLVCTFLNNVVRLGGVAVFVDTDFTLTGDRLLQLGLTELHEKLLYIQGDQVSLETLFDKITNIAVVLSKVDGYQFGYIAIDPFSTLVSTKELEGDESLAHYARQMSIFARKALVVLHQYQLGLIFVLHEKSKIGMSAFAASTSYISQNTLFAISSLELKVTRGQQIKDSKGATVAHEVIFEVRKNKIAPPFRKTKVVLTPQGYDVLGSTLPLLVEKGIIQKSGGWYTLPDGTKFQARAGQTDALDSSIKERIFSLWQEYLAGDESSEPTLEIVQ